MNDSLCLDVIVHPGGGQREKTVRDTRRLWDGPYRSVFNVEWTPARPQDLEGGFSSRRGQTKAETLAKVVRLLLFHLLRDIFSSRHNRW